MVTRTQRFLAFGFDLLLAAGLGFIPLAGLPLAALYLVLRDGCFQGQSAGKRLFGLRVVHAATQQPCDFARSCGRNVLWIVPVVSVVFAIEALWRVGHGAPGRHWGDRLADTQVVAVSS